MRYFHAFPQGISVKVNATDYRGMQTLVVDSIFSVNIHYTISTLTDWIVMQKRFYISVEGKFRINSE